MATTPLEIVVVDDEIQITELIELFLESAGRNAVIHSFNNPREARDYISTHPLDVLITDYKMPEISGLELLDAAPAASRKILISGYVSEIAEDRLQKLNAIFFEKPVPMRKLNDAVFGTV